MLWGCVASAGTGNHVKVEGFSKAGQLTVQLSVFVQKCSSGFYREWAGPYRGQCVPCSCNGLSNECDQQTGNCLVGATFFQF
uniref:Uncharacterized protein n=1 Tax=Sander lucioperca TaxID=283035 RepID=A0A8C9Y3W0_SANLU